LTLAIAQQVQEVPKTPQELGKRPGEETTWIKVCTKDEKTGNKQICLVKHEGLDPKTGAILIAAGVRTIEGSDTQHLVVNVPTAYTLVVPTGVQIKIDDGKPIQLQYSVCLPTNCQVQQALSKEMAEEMRRGKQMFVAAMNVQQKTMPSRFRSRASAGPWRGRRSTMPRIKKSEIRCCRHPVSTSSSSPDRRQRRSGKSSKQSASLRPRRSSSSRFYSFSFLFFLLKSSSTNPPLHSGAALRAAFA
jgi:invasion protein IalB